MIYRGYNGAVRPEGDGWFGRVTNASVVITFAAKTLAEVWDEFHASVDEYLRVCEEQGIVPEQPE